MAHYALICMMLYMDIYGAIRQRIERRWLRCRETFIVQGQVADDALRTFTVLRWDTQLGDALHLLRS